jgi:hypothetical protein
MNSKELTTINERLKKLENAVFGKKQKVLTANRPEDYGGLVGGLKLLVQKGFFNSRRGLAEIRSELSANDYHYSLQAVNTAVTRLSKSSGPLVAFKENGKKVYAKRK